MLRRARKILGDEHEAREVLQDVFTSLVDRPGQFGGQSSLLTFLYSATTHRCLNRLRDQRNRLRLVTSRGAAPEGASVASPEGPAAAREILRRVPDELARVAVYYYFDELTQAEIAELLGCSRRHVGGLLERFHAAARNAGAGEEAVR